MGHGWKEACARMSAYVCAMKKSLRRVFSEVRRKDRIDLDFGHGWKEACARMKAWMVMREIRIMDR